MKDKQMGKFENAKQLYDAYCALESEFTKRCQKMAEMEKELEELKNRTSSPDVTELMKDADFINEYVLTNDQVSSAVVTAYLKSLKNKDRVSVLGADGAVALFVSKKPTSLKEAKELADVIIRQG
ncbi:MAG: hypothetical protein J6C23_06850 [Clostridia bacterium]|nr:hypothetical protein [Clostridia bacterium]